MSAISFETIRPEIITAFADAGYTLVLSLPVIPVRVVSGPVIAQAAMVSQTRTAICESIQLPLSTRTGCGGFACEQVCTSTDPDVIAFLEGDMIATPAYECQACPGYKSGPA